MRRGSPILLVAGAMLALLLAGDVLFAQCAMCRTGLVNSPEGQRMAQGFNKGILFLLAAPFAVTGAMALLIFRTHLRLPFQEAAGLIWFSAVGLWRRPTRPRSSTVE